MSADLILESLRRLVEAETPSGDIAGLEAGFGLLADVVEERTGRRPLIGSEGGVPYLHLEATASPSILVLGHLDTVWPRGTLHEIPFRATADAITGPGVFDMKAGLAISIEAMAICASPEHVGLLVTGDEELGSPTGRAVVERFAPGHAAVVVPEPAGDGGGIKAARKGVSLYRLTLTGRAAHAGLEPHQGASTTVELAALVGDLMALEDPTLGTTVTPTVATSGRTVNTVPDHGVLYVDVRSWTVGELERVDAAVRHRLSATAGVVVEVSGGVNRPPLEAESSSALVELALEVAEDVGLGRLTAEAVGGGSDGNFCAALGIPTLDGAGAVGGGAHARHEWVVPSCLAERSRWLARVFEQVAGGAVLTEYREPTSQART